MCEPKGFFFYKERHDRTIPIVLWRLLKESEFKQEEPWYKLEANQSMRRSLSNSCGILVSLYMKK